MSPGSPPSQSSRSRPLPLTFTTACVRSGLAPARSRDYLALKLRSNLVKADRQIGAARGLIAGRESLGVVVLVNQESDTLARADALAALDRLLAELANVNVVVYLHDWCVTEQSWRRRDDGTLAQLHRVSVVGDPSHSLCCAFVKELRQDFTTAFRAENLGPSETVFVKSYPPGGPASRVARPATPQDQGAFPGELWFDPESWWPTE